jgi:hypothetical protein
MRHQSGENFASIFTQHLPPILVKKELAMQVQFIKKSFLMITSFLLCLSEASAAETTQKSREEIHKIMDSCFQSAGLTKPSPGERPTAPTAEQSASIDTCMKENNVQPPTRREGRGGNDGPPPQRSAAIQ